MRDVFLFLPYATGASSFREVHPYGPVVEDPNNPLPAGEPEFHWDLAVEISPQAIDGVRVVAIVSGLVRLIPDSTNPTICSLILMPFHDAARDLKAVVGGANVAFVYRNIVRPVVSIADNSTWPKTPLDGYGKSIAALKLPSVEPPDLVKQMEQFATGTLAVEAKAGQLLLAPSILGGHNGWNRVGFEIVYVPNGIGEEMNWSRLLEIVDPSKTRTRRLDPTTFFHSVLTATADVRIAPAHANHPLFSICEKRVLLEVRDEYDEPIVAIAEVTRADGSTTNQSLGSNAFGTAVLDAGGGDYTVALNLRVLTNLPSGASAKPSVQRILSPPAHWAIQSLFLTDLEVPDNWFVANTGALRRFWPGNRVTPIRDGAETFRRYAEALRSVTEPGHFAYVAGWILMDDFALDEAGQTAYELLAEAANMGGAVRVLLWEQAGLGQQPNDQEVVRLNALAPVNDVEAALDGHTHDCDAIVDTGTHHQKFLLIRGAKGRDIAFVGGIDFNQNRRDSDNHGAAAGYHDVHAMLDGPAVTDVHRAFFDRWTADPARGPVESPPQVSSSPQGSVFAQVACTYPRMLFQQHAYPFAPNGSFTPLEAFLRAIRKAKKFIYIEDQYLTPYPGSDAANTTDWLTDDSLGVLNELRDALSRIDYLIMVIPNHVSMGWLKRFVTHPGQARYRRQQFIRGLMAVAPDKVHVYYLARRRRDHRFGIGEDATPEGDGPDTSGSPDHPNEIYCHSKLWMVDDICMKIGSANCNQRSYTHDSEMDLVMIDGSVSDGARTLVRRFRCELWGEHLGISWPDHSVLDDHLIARNYWLAAGRPAEARIRDYAYDDLEGEGGHTGWTNLIDPNARDTSQ